MPSSTSTSSSVSAATNGSAAATASTSVSNVPTSSASASASTSSSVPSSTSSSSERGPFLIVGIDGEKDVYCCEFATEAEFRTELSHEMKQIQSDYKMGYIVQLAPIPTFPTLTEEETAAFIASVGGGLSLEDAIRKFHATLYGEPIVAPTEEEVAAVLSGEMALNDAVSKIHSWHELNEYGTKWREVKEIVQPTSNNPRATIRDVGRRS